MAELKNITVNVSLNGPIDVEKIAEEVKASIRKEIERVGIKLEVAKSEPLKVGDYIVALPESEDEYTITNTSMKLGKITDTCNDEIEIEIIAHEKNQEVGQNFEVKSKYFRKATPEEFTEAERDKVIIEKWAKIGRKPNELKKGDIVRVIDGSCSGLDGYEGIMAEIDEIDDLYHVISVIESDTDTWLDKEDIELIAPVEARFDR